jgi:hypothetical protein
MVAPITNPAKVAPGGQPMYVSQANKLMPGFTRYVLVCARIESWLSTVPRSPQCCPGQQPPKVAPGGQLSIYVSQANKLMPGFSRYVLVSERLESSLSTVPRSPQ